VLVPPAVWCPPAVPPRCCVPPCGGRVPRVLPPPAVGSCPVCWCPPAVLWPRPRDHCYDRREATALDASILSLHVHGDTRGAATHTPTGRVSGGLGRCMLSSTARSRSRRSASRAVVQQPVTAAATAPLPTCNMVAAPVIMLP